MAYKATVAIFCGVALVAATPAPADEPIAGAQGDSASTPVLLSDKAAPIAPVSDPVSDKELDALRGGENLVVANQTLIAITSGNAINGNFTAGDVSISDSALSNFNGIGNILINTGAQVSLQSGVNVTINVSP